MSEDLSEGRKLVAIIDNGGRPRDEEDEKLEQALASLGLEVIHAELKGCDTCMHIICVCDILRDHKDGCGFRKASTCSIPIKCDHGFEVCEKCDPCTCATS